MSRIRMALAGVATAALTMVAAPASAQTANAAQPLSAPSDCPKGDVCFYTGWNYSGQRCNWTHYDNDWSGGPIQCSWSSDLQVKSVYNNGYAGGPDTVIYYHYDNLNSRGGCTGPGQGGNLTPKKLQSHEWEPHC